MSEDRGQLLRTCFQYFPRGSVWSSSRSVSRLRVGVTKLTILSLKYFSSCLWSVNHLCFQFWKKVTLIMNNFISFATENKSASVSCLHYCSLLHQITFLCTKLGEKKNGWIKHQQKASCKF